MVTQGGVSQICRTALSVLEGRSLKVQAWACCFPRLQAPDFFSFFFFNAVDWAQDLKTSSMLGTCFFFFAVLDLNLGPTSWATPALFMLSFFQDRVSPTVCLGWLWITILLSYTASWVARITLSYTTCFVPYLFLNSDDCQQFLFSDL
jgi:hypothetical protein